MKTKQGFIISRFKCHVMLFHVDDYLILKAVAVWTRCRDTPMSHLSDIRTHTHASTHTRSPLPVLIRSSVKMLLLLLGIILLHIAGLVLLFVSTIVSVSATCS